jgi:hypothetical protein
MNDNPNDTRDAQLEQRAAELLGPVGREQRLELLAAMDPDEMAACLTWLIGYRPVMFDYCLVRDRELAGRLWERLDQADADQDRPEPYCTLCGAAVGIFYAHGEGWLHYRGEGTAACPVDLFDPGHQPEIAWRPAGDGAGADPDTCTCGHPGAGHNTMRPGAVFPCSECGCADFEAAAGGAR